MAMESIGEPKSEHKKAAYVDLDSAPFMAVELLVPPGRATTTIIFYDKERLSPFKLAIALEHGVPLRFK